ncbi:hypothetical protein LINGRAPRIM_LOCUS111 [Linum grandiflorum]
MTISSMKEVRDAIQKHVIKELRDLKWVKNECKRVWLRCKSDECGWVFFVSHNPQFNVLQLKKYIEQVCPEHYRNKFVTL